MRVPAMSSSPGNAPGFVDPSMPRRMAIVLDAGRPEVARGRVVLQCPGANASPWTEPPSDSPPPLPATSRRAGASAIMPRMPLNTYYWLDPSSRVTGLIMRQILPFADVRAVKLYGQFERGLYETLTTV